MINGMAWCAVSHTGAGGLGEKHLVTNDVAWHSVSHTGAEEKGGESKNWMLWQTVKKRVFS